MKLTKEKLQQIIKEELEKVMNEGGDFPHDLWKEYTTLKNRAPLFDLMDRLGKLGARFEDLLQFKQSYQQASDSEGEVEDEDGVMQSVSYVEGSKIVSQAESWLNDLGIKFARKIAHELLKGEGHYSFRDDPIAMNSRYKELKGQFKTEPKDNLEGGNYITTIEHIPSGTSTSEESGMAKYGS
tara:strand:+ start:235 stop:783 length:549 start_codon:yes stop_codon:yes gene_type:complete